jgi:hypothetical protein
MADAREVKDATADAAEKAKASSVAAAKADQKADDAAPTKSTSSRSAASKDSAAKSTPAKSSAAKDDKDSKAEAKDKEGTSDSKEAHEPDAAPAPVGVQPEYVLDERHNRREGPEKNPANKAFPDEASGAHNAPLEKTKKERKLQAHQLDPYRNPHAALQEDQQWIINREQAEVTSSETPAGDSSPAPEAPESANWVDTPARAHTLSEPDDYNTADSVGKRLRRAAESARLEERPDRRGIHSDALPGAYRVEEELRLQWPGISLGDDEDAHPALGTTEDEAKE